MAGTRISPELTEKGDIAALYLIAQEEDRQCYEKQKMKRRSTFQAKLDAVVVGQVTISTPPSKGITPIWEY